MADKEFDVIIIGAGPGGYTAALHACRLGAKTLLVERDKIGGTCLNRGCIPTKSLLRSVSVLEEVKGAKEYGVRTGECVADFTAMMQRKDRIVTQLIGGVGMLLKSWGVETMSGTAKFVDSNNIEVTGSDGSVTKIKSNKIVIATGSKPANVPGMEVNGDTIINSDHALQLKAMPGSVLIVGGGVIGVEFASIFNILGIEVTLVEMLPNIIPLEDEEISKTLKKSLEKSGIKIKTGTRVESLKAVDGKQEAQIAGEGGSETIFADKVLVAVGRTPCTDGLGVEELGIKMERGFITVNDKMETSVENVYAIGDVIGGVLLAHVAEQEGMVAVDNALGKESTIDYSIISSCIYCLPQVASMGLSEAKAKKMNIEYNVGRFPLSASGKAMVLGKREGLIKVLADKSTGKLLGVHIVGHEATELIAEAAIALQIEATIEDFTRISHAHPTLHESMLDAMEDVNDESIGLGRKKK